ncbi:hypothetical protein B6N60_02105 [Richelia sinica FACHB-800]|uniref:Uncharacterized protein n=1 Tax=Richelia sinica FACHB-800 TaxID=1357546 RepID=A0A975Y4Q3_9NOST|nr:hypothetical protein [Richelia sinica]MBD2666836.1 hypothetical protein [Richelia sinica FACHB-800]QXE23415.1 hypothetical protein B6N60_02105 [Richelia sinica FACHB-800]
MTMTISSVTDTESRASLVSKLTKAYYRDDQQEKFMDLQAEIDSLLQQLQNLKNQREEVDSQGDAN